MGGCGSRAQERQIVDGAVRVYRVAFIQAAQGKRLTESALTYWDKFLGALDYYPTRSNDQETMLRFRAVLKASPEGGQSVLQYLRERDSEHLLGKALAAVEVELFETPPPYDSSVI